MKKIWVTLAVLGLLATFSMTVFAVDVKVSGEFYVAGMYLDKTTLNKDRFMTSASVAEIPGTLARYYQDYRAAVPARYQEAGMSTAFFYQRLRLKTDVVVSPGLTLITRFDALERAWGATRSAATTATYNTSTGVVTTSSAALASDSAGTYAENENIAFDWAYINYKSPIGTFDVGLMEDGRTGTVFGNTYTTTGRIKYAYVIGPVAVKADITKVIDNSYTAKNSSVYTDKDRDKYGLEGVFSWKDGMAGMKVTYYRYADTRPTTSSYLKNYFLFTPYAIAKIGPVDVQAEVNYANGNANKYEDNLTTTDVKMESWSAFLDATVKMNPVYFGATFAYVSGDDPGTTDKQEGALNGGQDWNPCLIMFNYYDRTYWAGAMNGYRSASPAYISAADGPMTNAWFFQIRAGVKPLAALDIMASVSYANADRKPTASWLYNDYGYEVDLTATYKITNNLSYMLGGGYLFTGKYFKADSDGNEVNNNYMLINKLTLTF